MSDEPQLVVEIVDQDAIRSIVTAETDMQVRTAKQFPRDMVKSLKRCTQLATMDVATAESCLYALPRAGKKIEGGSIRLAEILAHSWGNLRVQTRITNVGATTVTAQSTVWDLETNLAVSVEKQRRITGRDGRRYNEDMIVTTCNAAASIAMRDGMFRVVPKPMWAPIYEACKRKAIGDATTLVERRTSMLGSFQKMGVFEERLLSGIDKSSVEEITLEVLAELGGMFNAIRDGTLSVDTAFPALRDDGDDSDGKNASKASKVGAAAAQAAGRKPVEAPPEKPKPEPKAKKKATDPPEEEAPEEVMTLERFREMVDIYRDLTHGQQEAIRKQFGLGMLSQPEVMKLGPGRWGELDGALSRASTAGAA